MIPTGAMASRDRLALPYWKKHLVAFGFDIVAFTGTVPFLFVLVWMLLGSFKTQLQNTAIPPLLVFQPTLGNYRAVLTEMPILQFFVNSLIVGVGSTGLGLLAGLPAAFSIARHQQTRLGMAILAARMMPGISYLIPWFILFTQLKLIGTYPGVTLSHLTVTMPLIIWIMIGFFEDLPSELHEAALIDGCSVYGAFWRIALPLVKPGIVAAGILAFIFSWNNFMLTLILGGNAVRTLPVVIYSFISYTQIDWGRLNATAMLVTLPVLVLTLVVQRHITAGLTLGGVKS